MTLTKREKRLLFLLAVVIVAVCIFRFGMMPLHEKLLEEQQRLQEVSAERAEMEEILRDGKLAKQYRQAAREAEDNYGSFHSILNSYTIDNILNGLMEEHGLHVQNLQISPYRTVREAEILPEAAGSQEEGEEESLLMLSEVNLLATGGYEDAKAFVDALNEKSFCLRVEHLQIDFNSENDYGDEARVSATVRIYGVRMPEEDLGFA
ncbi:MULTISPECIES: type II secretion system protein GspM [Anaerotruncus]|uniref:Type II secretion system protein M n=2 Tax=Anaerotruncus TaxID=244127 RepID=A0A498CJX5_9FIRM|nr:MULTISPECIES: type II secretion system protein GspM [Anaerotruncus]MBC3939795.1 type II secretion system protein M [Anaerotruncus massiliensis (ex Togo et al. 2019)]MCQ4896787.1 type II secretion system protein GspM [Anaerotruncus sp. DFI.9.16]RLL08039.1 hypothetical protein D4A47_12710 [Anaerotruncus massiliensis (ex Liu et al. 2021)]GKH47640.1 hypothetical protein CE91St45_22020 [Oscillospiraceae bacterium]